MVPSARGCPDRLRLHVERLALQRLAVEGDPTRHAHRTARRHVRLGPALDLLVDLLAACVGALRYDLAPLVLHERLLLEAANRLLLAPTEDQRLREAAPRDLRDALALLHHLRDLRPPLALLHRRSRCRG